LLSCTKRGLGDAGRIIVRQSCFIDNDVFGVEGNSWVESLEDCFLGVREEGKGVEAVAVEVTADIVPSSRVHDPCLSRSKHRGRV
jgi:hypothetical protein